MRRLSLIIVLILLLAGCTKERPPDSNEGPENTVRAYVSAASQASWGAVRPLLSGEALQGFQQNTELKNSPEKILSIKIETLFWISDIAVVYGEVSKVAEYEGNNVNNIAAYEFKLQKNDGQWKIYKVTTTDIMRPDLKQGSMPSNANEKIKTYLELPVNEKHDKSHIYLAGPALAGALKFNNESPIIQSDCKVLEITPAGVTDSYIVAQVKYQVEIDGYKPAVMMAVADMVDISGEWKIINLDIAGMDRGEG